MLRSIQVAVALTSLAASAAPAYAFKCSRVAADSGPSLTWQEREIPWFTEEAVFGLVGDAAVGEAETRGAFEAWEEVDCSDMRLPYMGTSPALVAEFFDDKPNRNVVVAIETGWDYDTKAIAVTTSAYDTRSGRVVDADIEINAQNFDFEKVDAACDSSMDLRNTLTHEVGHVIGLEHPPNTPRYANSTMFASAPTCETKKRSLEADDVEGICFIYPTGAPTEQCFPPEGPSFVVVDSDEGYGGCSHQRGGDGWTLLVVVAFFGLVRRR